MVRLSYRDLRSALEFVHRASSVSCTKSHPQQAVELLAELVPGELVGYYEWDLDARYEPVSSVEAPVVPVPAHVAHARMAYCSSYPLSILRWRSETRALKVSDFLSVRELHRTDYYDAVLRPYRIEHQMRLWLAAPPRMARVFYFSRRGTQGDFDERDRSLLELLRPFLVAVRERCDVPAADDTHGRGLTDREAEILALVARGKTNYEIAALLCLSPHTVRKHLEHVFEKLHVHTRAAAVARAFSNAE
jgi:DNA-binding CsgD family transcriptional regulator